MIDVLRVYTPNRDLIHEKEAGVALDTARRKGQATSDPRQRWYV